MLECEWAGKARGTPRAAPVFRLRHLKKKRKSFLYVIIHRATNAIETINHPGTTSVSLIWQFLCLNSLASTVFCANFLLSERLSNSPDRRGKQAETTESPRHLAKFQKQRTCIR